MITIIDPIKNLDYEFTAGVKGEYLPYIVNPDGSEEYPLGTDMIPNIITNIGIDRWMTSATSAFADTTFTSSISFCRVGSGTNAAAVTDTALQTQLTDPAPTSTNFAGSGGCFSVLTNANSLGTATHKITKQFPALVGASATINEIGLGWAATTASTLFSRVVLPSAINLIQGQVLRVVYQITISIPQYIAVSNVGSTSGFNIQGTGSNKGLRMVYNPQFNFGNLNTSGAMQTTTVTAPGFSATYPSGFIWQLIGDDQPRLLSGGGGVFYQNWGAGSVWMVKGSTTNPLTTFPPIGQETYTGLDFVGGTGTIGNWEGSSLVSATYTGAGAGNNTKYKDRTFEWSVSNPIDTTSGITGFVCGNLMILFDSNQTKSNEYRLRLTLRSSWARLP